MDLFASSGGAVNALALVATHPEDVRTLVAHEPPAASALPDADMAVAACRDIQETYHRGGFGPAMAKFIGLVSAQGPLPADYLDRPAPDPAMFGLPAGDDGTRTDPLLQQNIVTCNAYEHDFDALRAASTRVVIGVGTTSADGLAGRGGLAVAERLGIPAVTFPGGHDGFLGGEYGGMGEPDAFAADACARCWPERPMSASSPRAPAGVAWAAGSAPDVDQAAASFRRSLVQLGHVVDVVAEDPLDDEAARMHPPSPHSGWLITSSSISRVQVSRQRSTMR